MKNVMQIFLFFLSLLIVKISTLKCGADQLNHITIYKIPSDNYLRQLESDFRPIKIKMDYTYLESQNKNNVLVQRVENVLNKVVTDFESLLSVRHANFLYQKEYFSQHCGIMGGKYSSDYTSWGQEYDIAIIPYFNDSLTSSTVQAAATACVAISQTMMPKLGIIMINPKMDFSKQNSEKFMELLFLHEMSHVLIFHPSFFVNFDMLTQKLVKNEIIYYIKSPKVIEKAKQHFGCDSILGIPLENYGGQGSSGSHWEARYMLGDYMIATDYPEIVISDITLAVFEDSGLYKVNYYTGGLFRFGKGEGCNFLNTPCISNGNSEFANEFCIKSQEAFCTSGHLSKGHCYIAQYNSNIDSQYQYFEKANVGGYEPADYCPISFDNLYDTSNYYFSTNCKVGKQTLISSDYGEKIGSNSICVESSLLPTSSPYNEVYRSICYDVSCDKSNKNIILNINGGKVVCPKEGGLIRDPSGFKGKVVCPDYNSVCTSQKWCNDPLECIANKITADPSSYQYDYILPGTDDSGFFQKISPILILLIISLI